jgi:hypothetical protein
MVGTSVKSLMKVPQRIRKPNLAETRDLNLVTMGPGPRHLP